MTLAALEEVVGVDNLNDYYDPSLKQARLDRINARADSDRFEFIKGELVDRDRATALVFRLRCPISVVPSQITRQFWLEGAKPHRVPGLPLC